MLVGVLVLGTVLLFIVVPAQTPSRGCGGSDGEQIVAREPLDELWADGPSLASNGQAPSPNGRHTDHRAIAKIHGRPLR